MTPVTLMEKGRAEAFSDGVFAIAITLLILEIRVPHNAEISNRELAHSLLDLWPSFLAFVASFVTILVLWINHHGLFTLVHRTYPRFLFANGVLLLLITFLPFSTALVARHLAGPAANTAAVFYCGTYVLTNLAFHLTLSAAATRHSLRSGVRAALIQRIRTAYTIGFFLYVAATVIAWYHALAGIITCSLLWLLWATLSYSDADEVTEHRRA